MKTIVNWHLPIKTASESNLGSEHWTKSAKRHRLQKEAIAKKFKVEPPPFTFPCLVILTRIAPRELDPLDNLPTSMKYVIDAVSENLTGIKLAGRADRDKRISWEIKQKKGKPKEYAVQIEIISEMKIA